MNSILVSIILPVYNAENTLSKTLRSIMNQTYKNFEIIAVNDGSCDSSLEILRSFILRYPEKPTQIINQLNKGVSAARNIAISNASGDYYAFIDSDDMWTPNKLEKQINLFEKYSVEMVGTPSKKGGSGRIYEIHFKQLLFKNKFNTSGVIISKNAWCNTQGFDKSMGFSEDYKLWLEIVYSNKTIIIDEYLVSWDDPNQKYKMGGLRNNLRSMQKGELTVYQDLYLEKTIMLPLYSILIAWSYVRYFKRLFRRLLQTMFVK